MRRWPLLLSLLLAAAVGAPALVGEGVDVPDDALYYELASWEWLKLAWTEGRSPWFVGGKLGGVSLFVDTIPMGPFYPAVALLLLLPAGVALPLSTVLHALGVLLSVRWFARTLGASPTTASLAGAAVAVGPVGAFGFVDARGIAWATLLWLPVALGAFERARAGDRLRWLAVCGAALALILLGSHVRLSAAAFVVFGLWTLTAGRQGILGVPPILAALLAGAPGYVPLLREWGQADRAAGLEGKLATLAGPAESGMTLLSLPGLLTPRPWASWADYSIGVVLTVVLALYVGRGRLRLRSAPGRAAALGLVLLLAALSPALGALRWVFAPLLVFSHPVDDVYSALAMIPLAAAGAVALDARLAGERPGRGPILGVLTLALGAFAVLQTDALFRDEAARGLYRLACLQLAVVLPLTALALARPRRAAIVLLALTDLGFMALRLHTAVPSDPLPLHDRTDVPGVEQLADGYLDIDDIARLEPFRYAGDAKPAAEDEAPEFWEDTAETMQAEILHRRWPAHLGLARGYRGLSGRAKLIPARQSLALGPLVAEIQGRPLAGEQLRSLFEERGMLGERTLFLHGIAAAAAPDGTVLRAPDRAPTCYAPPTLVFFPDPRQRLRHAMQPGFHPALGEGVVEDEAWVDRERAVPEVTCRPGGATVRARDGGVVVFSERFHPGWRVEADDRPLETFPVNVVHTGVVAPPGASELTWRFVPPGLHAALGAAAVGWLLLLPPMLWRPRSHPSSAGRIH